MKKIIPFIFLCLCSLCTEAQKYLLSGIVKDASTGKPLVSASVGVEGTTKGTYTDATGHYKIELEKGNYVVEYWYLGYKSFKYSVSLQSNQRKDVALQTEYLEIEKVSVVGQRPDFNVTSTNVGVQTLNMQEIKQTPVLFGENDPLKTLQLMPGVKSAGEGGSGFYVRGGGADQNLILLDEAPVFNASHMMGMFSVFNADALEDVKIYTGSMSSQYGGRLSSVLDVSMREGGQEGIHGQAGIGLISSRFEVDGPIQKGKSSFLVAGRRTYADLFLKLSSDEELRKTKLHFYDVNYKLTQLFGTKDRLTLSGYIGRDVFKFRDMFEMDGGNVTSTLAWIHLGKQRIVSSLVFSHFNSLMSMNLSMMDASLKSGITNFNWKEDFEYRWETNTLRYGGNVALQSFSPGKLKTSMLEKEVELERRTAVEASVYIDDTQNIRDVLTIQSGLRFSNYFGIGAATYYDYNDEHEVIDSTLFDKGELINHYPFLEPRLSIRYRLNETSSLKASYTRTTQYVHLIQSSTVAMPTDYWMPSTNKTKPQTCSQISCGYFRNFKDNMYESSVELYYKKLNNQTDYENGTNLFLNAHLEAYLLYGHGRSYGAEFFLKKREGALTGWISYCLSKSEKQFQGINSGKWYPVRYDRTHDISIVAMYNFSERWQASASWVYSTGDAVTYPSGKYYIDGEIVSYYTERNGYRMPAYHRMDVGVTYNVPKKKRIESQWSASIYNVYNRKNAYMIYFEPVDEENPDVLQAVKVTLFPIIPSVSWNCKF